MSATETGKTFLLHRDFTTKMREKLTDKGQAMPGGGFPIRNQQDLKNAIQAYGRAKNKPAAMAWIIKRAKALGLTDILPEGWVDKQAMQSETVNDVLEHYGTKGMKWGVRRSRRSLSRAAKASTGKSVKDLSDQELRTVVNRMNMEQQYSRLTGGARRGAVAAGAAFAGTVLVGVARTQLTNAANAQVSRALGARKK